MRLVQLQLKDARLGSSIVASGGAAIILKPGLPDKQTIYDPVTELAIANPVALSNGKLAFKVADTVLTFDLAMFAPGGQFVFEKGLPTQGLQDLPIFRGTREQVALIPYSIADLTANTETDMGLDLPANAVVSPNIGILPTVAAVTGTTLLFGTLSTESGGDADGFLVAMPANSTINQVVAAKSAATATRGALIGAGTLDRGYSTDANTAKSLSITLVAGWTLGKGFIVMPYTLAGPTV